MEDLRNEQFEDYVNLSEVYLTLKREIKLFAFIIILISGIGFVRAKLSKPIWKGTFQIVLTDKSSDSFSAAGRLQGLLNKVSKVPKDIETQVKILKSPVILRPAFERFIEKFPEETKNYSYKDWYRNIAVNLDGASTVLKASFTDTNRDILIPALNEISQEYKNYSKRDQERKFENTLKYLNDQISYYQKKSKLSLEKAQTFAIEFYLTPLTGKSDIDKEIQSAYLSNNDSSDQPQKFSYSSTTPINIELERLMASNDKKIYETKLEQLKNINDENTLFLLGKTEQFMGKRKITNNIELQNIKIERFKTLFTENDPKLQSALQTKKTYLNTFKNELYGFLNAKLLDAEARLTASERPEGVLVKYKELLRESKRDEEFLNKLELDRQLLVLEKSVTFEPWEIVAYPTVISIPVSYTGRQMFFIWTFVGIIISGILTLIKENLSGVIFTNQKIINLINFKLLAILKNTADEKDWTKEIMLPFNEQEIEKLNKENINLISLGNIKNSNKEKIFSVFKDNFKNISEYESNDLEKKGGFNILLIEKGKITRNEVAGFLQRIKIYNFDIDYWILID